MLSGWYAFVSLGSITVFSCMETAMPKMTCLLLNDIIKRSVFEGCVQKTST